MGDQNNSNASNKKLPKNTTIAAAVIILMLISIAIYNYDKELGLFYGDNFIYRALYIIKGLLDGIVGILSQTISTELLSVIIVLLVFLGIAAWIAKE